MDKEKIIEQLNDEKIGEVMGITIRMNLSGKDYLRIDYLDGRGQLKNKIKYIKSEA